MSVIVEAKDLSCYQGDAWVLTHLNLSVFPGEILAIVGGSGSGKSTLLRHLMLLQPPTRGSVHFLGTPIDSLQAADALRTRMGVMFQHGALFSALTVLENVMFPLREHTPLTVLQCEEIARLKIALSGLPDSAAHKYPSELSGGMQKRAALARALALEPEVVFLDEPTAGLDPQSAALFDELIIKLQAATGLTIVMVTHDVDSLWQVSSRVAFLGQGRVLQTDSIETLSRSELPDIQQYFSGARMTARGIG